ncbi:vacuolar protein sorting-associated protein 54-like [Liolophura sinensis]|uniref:vacuolar protein sorting-associated protein 54-like n=1 Tax=Liolophura sinensis TaxID=3198878 RepID=UPI0031584D12
MATVGVVRNSSVSWRRCSVCQDSGSFKSPRDFCRHLRDFHCTKEGGSFVCRYGSTGVCPSLPVEGVSDKDYEDHVVRHHVYGNTASRDKGMSSARSEQYDLQIANSSHTQEPSVVQDQHKWTVYQSSINLPALLNDPRLSKRETDFFTKTWGDSFENTLILPSPYLREITQSHFEKYLHKTSTRYKKHQRLKALPEKADNSQISETSKQFSGGHIKQLEKNREELEQVPKIFMLPNFTLDNPDTFMAVFPWTQVEESRDATGRKQSSKLLQEKLSHYLDIVEVQIAKQISVKSDAFFHAMSSHEKLQDYLLETCKAVKQLRDKIHEIDTTLARGPLKVMSLTKTRSNYVNLHNKLKLMSTVHQTQPTIQLLLSTNEFVGALDLISTSQEVLTQELAGVHCFRHLGSQLAEMEKLIEKMLQADFVKYAMSDLNRPVTDSQVLTQEEKLVAILFGMLRFHKFNFIEVYKEEVCATLKSTIKQTVVEAVAVVDDINTEGNVSSLADQMRLLNYPLWMDLLKTIFANLLVILNRAKEFCAVVRDVVGIAAGRTKAPTPISSPTVESSKNLEEASHLHVSVSEEVDVMVSDGEFYKLGSGLKEMLCTVCDHAHDRCVKVLAARAKDGFIEKLNSTEFVGLSREIEQFVQDCGSVCGRRSTSLRGSLQSQANRFVNRFHDERKTKLSLILDNERWKQADVPSEFQQLVDHIRKTGQLSLPEKKIDIDSKPSEVLIIEDQKYVVVGTVLLLLKMVVEYCQLVDDIPSACPDILTRLIDLLKSFNSRTCQLVLGAGALQLVGLRKISTRNLALASRCLQLIVFYIPLVKTHFQAHLSAKQVNMLKHFDQISKDYKDHIEEIDKQLLAILDSMFEVQLSKWEVKPPMPSNCFRSISKQIARLHEAIVDLLPHKQIQDLFKKINKSFKSHLRLQLTRLGVNNNGGPQHGLVTADLAFFSGNYKTLKGLEELAHDFNDVWEPR